jgi:hypothetical protein
MTNMATAKDAPADPPAPPKPPRRCAKCATPASESSFKNEKGQLTPYCEPCRGRFPALAAPRFVVHSPRPSRQR